MKTTTTVIAAALLFALLAASAQAATLVGHWQLEETGIAQGAVDASGTSPDGTYSTGSDPNVIGVPGFGLFRSQERAMFLFSFSMAVLAGVGTSTVLRGLVDEERERLGRLTRSVGWLAVAVLLTVLLFQYGWTDAGLSGSSRFRLRVMSHNY